MPLRYRQEIRPRFHAWITEGFAKYAKHKATAAGLELAQMLLDYQPSAHGFSYELAIRNIMSELKANGIGPQEILIRVAELVAFMETNPSRLKSQREEDFALARNVMHLTPRNLRGRRHGAKVMQHLGPLIREHCYVWAGRFVRRLREDRERVSELKRQAITYD